MCAEGTSILEHSEGGIECCFESLILFRVSYIEDKVAYIAALRGIILVFCRLSGGEFAAVAPAANNNEMERKIAWRLL